MIFKQHLNIPSFHYKELLSLLPAASRLIGGCVRDAALNIVNSAEFDVRSEDAKPIGNRRVTSDDTCKFISIDYKTAPDIDITTALLPNQIMEILSRRKITVIPTGLKHGTVTVIFKNEKFEITTLRRDISTNGRHAKVQFTDSFEEDAARRDFTINALSYCPFKEELYDYHNGIEDLQNQRVVFIGDPYKRIKEDFLRILRFFRFSCYYAKDLDKASLEACSELKESLKLISRERIKSEFDKIILHPNSLPTLQAMDEIGLLKSIMPIENYDPSRLQSLWDFLSKHQLMHIKSIEILYALLLSNLDKKRLLALKFSKSESAQILSLQETMNDWSLHSTEFNLLKLWLNRLNYVTYIAVVVASGKISEKIASRFISEHQQLTRPKFPVTGVDLKNSLQPKEIGLKLKELKDLWIESGFKLTKSELLGSGSKIDL